MSGSKRGFGGMAAARPVEEKLLAKLQDDGEAVRRVHFHLEEAKYRRLKVIAAGRGQTVRALLTELIDSLPDE